MLTMRQGCFWFVVETIAVLSHSDYMISNSHDVTFHCYQKNACLNSSAFQRLTRESICQGMTSHLGWQTDRGFVTVNVPTTNIYRPPPCSPRPHPWSQMAPASSPIGTDRWLVTVNIVTTNISKSIEIDDKIYLFKTCMKLSHFV